MRFSDYHIVSFEACFVTANTKCPECKKCPGSKKDANPSLRKMQEFADAIWNRKKRYTPEVLKLRRILRKMLTSMEFRTNSPKSPTRTTENTYKEMTTDKRGKSVSCG